MSAHKTSDDVNDLHEYVEKPTIYVGADFARPGSDVTVVRWECLPCGNRVQAELKAPSRVAKCPMCGHEIPV